MEFRILHVEDKDAIKYAGLKAVGGEANLYQEMVGENFNGWENYYDKRQSAILDGSPRLFDGKDRSFQLDFLKRKLGMKPSHKLLDYGCATVAAGQHSISYLDSGNYVGMDISESAIELGRERIQNSDLKKKKPTLYHLKDGALPDLPKDSFDFAVAFSVFTHCPPEVVVKIMAYVTGLLKSGGVFVAQISASEKDIIFQGFHNFYYPKEFIEQICSRMQLKCEVVEDEYFDMRKKSPRLLGIPMNAIITNK